MPKIGSNGERYREKQLAYQLPKQDLALAYCKHVEPQHHSSYDDFVGGRNEIALDIAYVKDAPIAGKCVTCTDGIDEGEMAVIAPKFTDQVRTGPTSAPSTNFLIFLSPFIFPIADVVASKMFYLFYL